MKNQTSTKPKLQGHIYSKKSPNKVQFSTISFHLKKVKLKIWSTFSPTHQNICQRSSTLASSTLDLPHIRKVHMCDFQNFGLIFEEQYFFPLKRCMVFWNFFDWSCLDWRKMVILVLDHVTNHSTFFDLLKKGQK